jgi:hypothetical protein
MEVGVGDVRDPYSGAMAIVEAIAQLDGLAELEIAAQVPAVAAVIEA